MTKLTHNVSIDMSAFDDHLKSYAVEHAKRRLVDGLLDEARSYIEITERKDYTVWDHDRLLITGTMDIMDMVGNSYTKAPHIERSISPLPPPIPAPLPKEDSSVAPNGVLNLLHKVQKNLRDIRQSIKDDWISPKEAAVIKDKINNLIIECNNIKLS